MTHYLIEFRFFGKSKYEMKQLIHNISYKFRLGHKRAIPHISLAGPFTTTNEARLINDFKNLCSANQLMRFKIDGFDVFKDNRVVFINIKPSQELNDFRWELSKKLQPYCKLNSYDYQRDFEYHATIAMKLDHDKFNRIKEYVSRLHQPEYKHFMIRVTLLKGQRILYEYDFLQRRLLGRWDAKNPIQYSKTMKLLKEFFDEKYDPNKNIKKEIKPKDEERVSRNKFIQWITSLFKSPKTFITSDLHLDHTNIITYCKRPFLNTEEMNKTLIENWNNTVSKKDTVYFLGDMSFGKGSRSADYWMSKLNGNIFFIRGFSIKPSGERNQHDRISKKENVFDNLIVEYKNRKFFLVHDPDLIPSDWKDWAICGHHHNNNLEEYPFIDKKNKRINISTELTEFRPVNMDDLIKKIEE